MAAAVVVTAAAEGMAAAVVVTAAVEDIAGAAAMAVAVAATLDLRLTLLLQSAARL